MNQRLRRLDGNSLCMACVVTQKRETVLFGAEDSGGWSPGADAWPGGAGKCIRTKEASPLGLFQALGEKWR